MFRSNVFYFYSLSTWRDHSTTSPKNLPTSPYIFVHSIRVHFFILDCPNGTDLGLSDGTISDSQITASTEYSHSPAAGVRLNSTESGWLAKSTDSYPWLQVDFQEVVNIAIIKTQGSEGTGQFVRTFSISFGNDGTNFADYQDSGRKKVLNKDIAFQRSCWKL